MAFSLSYHNLCCISKLLVLEGRIMALSCTTSVVGIKNQGKLERELANKHAIIRKKCP